MTSADGGKEKPADTPGTESPVAAATSANAAAVSEGGPETETTEMKAADAEPAGNADAKQTTEANTTVNSTSQSSADIAEIRNEKTRSSLEKEEASVESGKENSGPASISQTIDSNDGKRDEENPGMEKSMLGAMSLQRAFLTMTAL
ncbi:hypothetical protein LPJ56_005790, partial [Coemansia sp. RSA 2599]